MKLRLLIQPLLLLAVAACLLLPSLSLAQEGGGCVFNRRIYPEGFEMCQSGTRVRCEEGSWADIGMCDGDEPMPEPIEGGGDSEYGARAR